MRERPTRTITASSALAPLWRTLLLTSSDDAAAGRYGARRPRRGRPGPVATTIRAAPGARTSHRQPHGKRPRRRRDHPLRARARRRPLRSRSRSVRRSAFSAVRAAAPRRSAAQRLPERVDPQRLPIGRSRAGCPAPSALPPPVPPTATLAVRSSRPYRGTASSRLPRTPSRPGSSRIRRVSNEGAEDHPRRFPDRYRTARPSRVNEGSLIADSTHTRVRPDRYL